MNIFVPNRLIKTKHRNSQRSAVYVAALLISMLSVSNASAQSDSEFDARIIGGVNSTPGAYPWMAGLVVAGYNDAREGFVCGGTLIRPQWILTAAHCLESSRPGVPVAANLVDFVLGRERLSDSGGERIRAAQIFLHPKFSRRGAHDVALVRLSRPSTQPTLALIEPGSSLGSPGEIATTIGFGVTSLTGTRPSNRLQQVDIPIVTHKVCRNVYSRLGYSGIIVPDLMICAGYASGGRDACFGDSGGPLLTFNSQGQPQLTGVVSFGYGCAFAGIPGVYTRMTSYHDWVLVTLGEKQAQGLPPLVLPPESGTPIFTSDCTGLACAFNVTNPGQSDPMNYVWSFGDGYFAYGESTSHFYRKSKSYRVTLFVMNSDGSIVDDTRKIRPASDDSIKHRKSYRIEANIGQQKDRFMPNRLGFWSRGGLITGTLKDKSGNSDMQLDLAKFDDNTGSWVTVATSNNQLTRERIDYESTPGFYAWIVRNRSFKDGFVLRYWRPVKP